MNVFVTEASGFIGQYLLRHLSKAGHDVTVLLRPGRAECLAGSAHTVRGDITQSETLTSARSGTWMRLSTSPAAWATRSGAAA